MKAKTIKAGVILTAILLLFSTSSRAHLPQTRELSGVIEMVDIKKHTFTIRSPKRDTPFKLNWTADTEFFENQTNAGAVILKTGRETRVSYHAPFFGKPSASKVTLVSEKQTGK